MVNGENTTQVNRSLFAAEVQWLLKSPVMLAAAAHPAVLPRPLDNLSEQSRNKWLPRLLNTTESLANGFENQLSRRRSTRLGIRYETLWQCLYRNIPEYRILATNLQVRDQQKTWGEYDLIYATDNGQNVYHQELAIKFYLGRPGSTGDWFDWLGPDKIDQLGRKLKLMFERQITLSETSPGRAALEALPNMPDRQHWHREILLQGYLFYPWQQPCEPPANSNPSHLRGDWLPLHQLQHYLNSLESSRFYIPPRQQWMALEKLEDTPDIVDDDWLTARELEQKVEDTFQIYNRPLLVAPRFSGKPFFITPDTWMSTTA